MHTHVVKINTEQGILMYPCQSAHEAWQTGQHLMENGAHAFMIMPVRDDTPPATGH